MKYLLNKLNYANQLINILPKFIEKIDIVNEEFIVFINKKYLISVLCFLKNSTQHQFKILFDLTCIDYLNQTKRFEVCYFLLSVRYNFRLRISIFLTLNETVNSIYNIYKSSNWLEREIWDMFGIVFINHPDLRRILTDYGFEGHPLRKDFPLIGFTEIRYDDEKKSIIYEPIEMSQEFRLFDFLSPWEQIKSSKNYNLKIKK